jgi:hypothetical protein
MAPGGPLRPENDKSFIVRFLAFGTFSFELWSLSNSVFVKIKELTLCIFLLQNLYLMLAEAAKNVIRPKSMLLTAVQIFRACGVLINPDKASAVYYRI